jgi:hypothetical protein
MKSQEKKKKGKKKAPKRGRKNEQIKKAHHRF